MLALGDSCGAARVISALEIGASDRWGEVPEAVVVLRSNVRAPSLDRGLGLIDRKLRFGDPNSLSFRFPSLKPVHHMLKGPPPVSKPSVVRQERQRAGRLHRPAMDWGEIPTLPCNQLDGATGYEIVSTGKRTNYEHLIVGLHDAVDPFLDRIGFPDVRWSFAPSRRKRLSDHQRS